MLIFKTFRHLCILKFIVNIFKKIDNDVKYIITSCDTCFNSLNKVFEYLPQYNNIKEKLITFDRFIKIADIKLLPAPKNIIKNL